MTHDGALSDSTCGASREHRRFLVEYPPLSRPSHITSRLYIDLAHHPQRPLAESGDDGTKVPIRQRSHRRHGSGQGNMRSVMSTVHRPEREPATDAFSDVPAGGPGLVSVA